MEPILKFPDPKKPYVLFTEASKHVWAGVLTQPYTREMGDKLVTVHHPVTYVSGLFRCMLFICLLKKTQFLPYRHGIMLRSDHLPLKKFLLKNTLNSKLNNWAVELETFNNNFEHISGIQNT